jgi:hypothetical protein
MRAVSVILVLFLFWGCTKKPVNVTSIDQIKGRWKWESTCGGIIYQCNFSSKTVYASIEFTNDLKFIETHNDTVYLKTNYSITKYDDTFGTIVLENPAISLPVAIIDNKLLITRGELTDSYYKIN